MARALLCLGDVQVQSKEYTEAESTLIKAQAMIGSVFSENHPCIIEFNSNLVEVYSNKNEESDKLKGV